MVAPFQEEWKPVVGWEAFYEVSTFGRVRRIGKGHGVVNGALLAPQTVRAGYLAVNLRRPGIRKANYVHRLVADAFLGPIPEGMQVNHIDGNPKL